MNNPKINFRIFLTAILSAAFVFAVSFNASAQGRLDVRAAGVETEVKGAAQFADSLAQFLNLLEQIEKKGSATEAEIARLEAAGKRIKDGTSNLRRNLQGLVSKIKSANRWNEQFDTEFANSLDSDGAKGFLRRNGGARKLLGGDISPAIDSAAADVDAILNDVRNLRAANETNGNFEIVRTSTRAAKKGGFKCGLLFVGVAVAELAGAKLTAENIDKVFDKKCGGGAAAATT